MHRVLCFGGRDYRDVAAVDKAMLVLGQSIGFPFLIINGGARGADTLCKEWGLAQGFPVITMDAAWGKLGKGAGHVRNGWMLEYATPNYAVGFPGGNGTADMARKVLSAGLLLWRPYG